MIRRLTHRCGRPRPAARPSITANSGGNPRSISRAHRAKNMTAQAVIYWLTVHFLPVMWMRLARFSGLGTRDRSEEHASELQSLMRISYAVFCLKKKTTNYKRQHTNK